MLQALRSNPQRGAVAEVFNIQSPIGGLNARDPLARMKPTDAIILKNVFPTENTCKMRRGHASHATSMGASTAIQSLMTYHALNGTEKMFAGAGNKIYDVTTAGSATSVRSTGITVNKWQWINFSSSAGLHILAVNGTDIPLKYTGTAWTVNLVTGSIPTSAKTCINIFQHKERVWLVEKDTLNLWYLASQALAGTATKLPLGGVFQNGGKILAGGTLSVNDGGDGMDDLLVAVSSNGEAVVYSGTNPATDFLLVGRYDIPAPIGNRCLMKLGGDLIIITVQGAISLTAELRYDRAKADDFATTAKIRNSFNSAARNYKANFGWQGTVYPKAAMALINIPQVESSRQTQYVQNVITGAWCEFTDWNANCFGLLNDELYFGGNAGTVFKADTGSTDNGGQIQAEVKTAFNYCGSAAQNKQFTAIRPMLTASGLGAINIGIDVDFSDTQPTSSTSASVGTVGIWGTSKWGQCVWGGGLNIRKWLTVGKIGTCVAARAKCSSTGTSFEFNGFDLLYQKTKGNVF
jgi:hypothetical protein